MIEPIGVRKESILLTFSLDGTIEFEQFKIRLFKSNQDIILEYQNLISYFTIFCQDFPLLNTARL